MGNDWKSSSPLRAEGTVASGGVSGSWQSTAANEEAASIALKVHCDVTPFTVHARSVFFPPLPDLQTLCKGSVPSTQPLQGVEQAGMLCGTVVEVLVPSLQMQYALRSLVC